MSVPAGQTAQVAADSQAVEIQPAGRERAQQVSELLASLDGTTIETIPEPVDQTEPNPTPLVENSKSRVLILLGGVFCVGFLLAGGGIVALVVGLMIERFRKIR